jgi:hypothetical protein
MEAELEKLITVGGRESGINVFNSTNPITYTSQPRTPIRKVATPIEVAPPHCTTLHCRANRHFVRLFTEQLLPPRARFCCTTC